nr:DUF3375 family protein [Frigoribacterium sp. CFBP 8754]
MRTPTRRTPPRATRRPRDGTDRAARVRRPTAPAVSSSVDDQGGWAVEEPSGHDALSRDGVREVFGTDPTWALLRSSNSRWILPLFSRHLERAEGPVSADWFHQAVAEALAENAAEAAAGETASVSDTTPGEAPAGPAETADLPEAKTPADYCRGWVDSRWLIRTRASGEEDGQAARARYRLSPHALKALRIVRELAEADNAVSEARFGSIAHAVRQLAGLADPDPASQVARIDEQIAELQRRRDEVERHGPVPATADVVSRQVREVVRLTASLPEDFRQLSAMVEQRHREVARRATHEHVGKGALVEQYLRENDLLEQTPEGRAYRGFAQMLSSREIDVMRADIDKVLSQPGAAEHLTERQREQLEQLISSLLAEEQSVQETYGRWTSSLRRFLSRSGAEKHQRLLTLAERALHAGAAWAERRPGAAVLPEDVLGLGPVDVVDVSQVQLWSERGRPTVEVRVAEGDAALPAADRAALRLTAGTSPAAVAATIDRLLDEGDGRDEVTSADVYRATEPEFRRLALVLSMLDLAVERGVVTDETESVVLTPDDPSGTGAGAPRGGAPREVTLPRLVFTRDAPPPGADAPAPDDTARTLQGDPA